MRIQSAKFKTTILIFVFCIFNFLGCVSIKEAAKQIAGVSTRALEKARTQAIKKTFACNYAICYTEVKKIIAQKGFYIYAEDKKKKLIAIYVSTSDTTAVGIFLNEIDPLHTEIEVSSLSTDAKEFVSKNIFSDLEKYLSPERQEGQANAEK